MSGNKRKVVLVGTGMVGMSFAYAALNQNVCDELIMIDLNEKRAEGETVKAAVLKYGPYQGLQQQISFDATGDTQRKVFFTEIRDGRFVALK